MRAAVCEKYGPPESVAIVERPRPVPRRNEVLIQSRAMTVSVADARMRGARVPRGMAVPFRLAVGWTGPRQPVLGFDVAGDVVEVGADVKRFRVGDRVVGSRGLTMGCHAELCCIAEGGSIAHVPDDMKYEDATALLFGGMTARAFFAEAKIQPGERISINGASGAVGVMAVQLAKHAGAHVTAVCSAKNAALVETLGADEVIDYEREDFTRRTAEYDLVMDNHGNAPFDRVRHLLAPGGRYLLVIGDLSQMLEARIRPQILSPTDDGGGPAVRELVALAAAGKIRSVIDRTLPFEEVVEAHRIVDGGHKRGNVVLTLA